MHKAVIVLLLLLYIVPIFTMLGLSRPFFPKNPKGTFYELPQEMIITTMFPKMGKEPCPLEILRKNFELKSLIDLSRTGKHFYDMLNEEIARRLPEFT